MAGMLLLAGCTQDRLVDASQGEILPEGKYPVTFIATGLGTTAATRATAGGTWTKEDKVAVQVNSNGGNEIKEYAAADGSSAGTTLKAAEGVIPFYWKSTDETKTVSAWYCGDGSTAASKQNATTVPQTWSVQPDQNNQSDGYQNSGFLYAPLKPIAFKSADDNSLIFYHQTAKVVVNIHNQGVANDKDKVTVTINAVREGTFTTNLTNNCGLSAKTGVNPSGIKSFKLGNPNKSVVFKDGENAEDALVSFQTLVIPQTLGTNTPVEIQIEGYDTFKYTPSGSWAGGTQYTYNLTIDGKEVKATVTADKMTWTGDNSGAGSVTLPDVAYDLSTAGAITISDGRTCLITGSGTNNITISGGTPTVIFDGVTLNTSSSPSINITGGNPIQNFQGTNTLTTTEDNGICLSNDAAVIIKGNGAQNTELKISNYFGIGAYRSGSTCGNISLTSCKLDITTKNNGACIGASANTSTSISTCGDIELWNCEIINQTAKSPSVYSLAAAAIGCSDSYSVCGKIDIHMRDRESVDDFLTNITVDSDADKVGKGNNRYYTPVVGTVTWCDHAGTVVWTGTRK